MYVKYYLGLDISRTRDKDLSARSLFEKDPRKHGDWEVRKGQKVTNKIYIVISILQICKFIIFNYESVIQTTGEFRQM